MSTFSYQIFDKIPPPRYHSPKIPMDQTLALVVALNSVVKIRFPDGEKLTVQIFDTKPKQSPNYYPLSKNAPLAQALLGHQVGEKVHYLVGTLTHQVTILEITN